MSNDATTQFGGVLALESFERDGRRVEVGRTFNYVVREGKLGECWVHDEDQRLVDELWGQGTYLDATRILERA